MKKIIKRKFIWEIAELVKEISMRLPHLV